MSKGASDKSDRAVVNGAPDGVSALRASVPSAAWDIICERDRQIAEEGWTPEHDDGHADGSLAAAAATYAFAAATEGRFFAADPLGFWPWDTSWWKPSDARRNLIKAGALIVAEIERLDRAQAIEARRAETQSGADAPTPSIEREA